MTLADLLEEWDLIEVDFHRLYGVDLTGGTMYRRSFRWFMVRTSGLMGMNESLLLNRLYPQDPKTGRRQRQH